jgi:hypothetical protein
VKRLLRVVRASIAILSLLLCLATAILWIRSYFVTDDFQRTASHDLPTQLRWNKDHLMIGKGGIGVCRTAWSAPVGDPPRWGNTPFVRDSSLKYRQLAPSYPQFTFPRELPGPRLGFDFEKVDMRSSISTPTGVFRSAVLPLWFLVCFFLLLSLPESIYRYRVYSRRRRGHCPHCGYDLRASPDRCPECGKATSSIAQPEPSPAR